MFKLECQWRGSWVWWLMLIVRVTGFILEITWIWAQLCGIILVTLIDLPTVGGIIPLVGSLGYVSGEKEQSGILHFVLFLMCACVRACVCVCVCVCMHVRWPCIVCTCVVTAPTFCCHDFLVMDSWTLSHSNLSLLDCLCYILSQHWGNKLAHWASTFPSLQPS